jgi:hypothetical protein
MSFFIRWSGRDLIGGNCYYLGLLRQFGRVLG